MKKFGSLIVLSLWLPSALAAPQFVASEIPRSPDDPIHLADMNGDGRSDVLLAHWSEQEGRELYIYLQQADGRFPSQQSRTVEIRPEIIAFGTADLRAEPGAELVFVSSDAVYSFSSAIDSYSGNLKKLVDWPLIASTPERKELAHLGALPDLDKDGHADLLLPDEEGFGYFRGQGDEQFALVSKLVTVSGDLASVARRRRSEADDLMQMELSESGELDVSLSPDTSSEFVSFLSEWRADASNAAGGGLLRHESWIPALSFATVNDDALTDIVFINEADDDAAADAADNVTVQRQISVLQQNATGAFTTQPAWQAVLEPRSSVRLVEFTGDERVDLLRLSGGATEVTAYFYRNRAGTFDLENPDQVLRFSGLGFEANFSDLNKDGKPELGVTYFSTPVLDALRNTSVQRSRLIFANISTAETASGDEPGLLFSRRPDYKYDESISADNVLGLVGFGNLEVDLDGDGKKDYLQIAGDGTLTARSIDDASLQIAAETFWQYVPNQIVGGFTMEELNADARPDIILRHSRHITVLVSVE